MIPHHKHKQQFILSNDWALSPTDYAAPNICSFLDWGITGAVLGGLNLLSNLFGKKRQSAPAPAPAVQGGGGVSQAEFEAAQARVKQLEEEEKARREAEEKKKKAAQEEEDRADAIKQDGKLRLSLADEDDPLVISQPRAQAKSSKDKQRLKVPA